VAGSSKLSSFPLLLPNFSGIILVWLTLIFGSFEQLTYRSLDTGEEFWYTVVDE